MAGLLGLFIALVAFGIPIAFALGAASIVGLMLLDGVPLAIVASRVFGGIDSFTLLAIPFFILAGELMEGGGMSLRLVNLARTMVGHVRGGLGNVTIVAMMLFSGISGSTTADAAAVGSVMIPPMVRSGYAPERAAAIVAAAAGMGILVPPCLTMVVYGSVTNTSIAALFAAGFLPAFLMAGALLVHLRIESGRLGLPTEPRASLREFLRALRASAWATLIPVIIFGGILGGIFTPTEAAVVAAVAALLIGRFAYREIGWREVGRILARTGLVCGTVMLMIAAANIFSWILTVKQVPQALAAAIQAAGGGRALFLLLSFVVFLVLFALLDGLPAMLMVMPVFVPIAQQLGVDLLHYGIMITLVTGIALFLPPFGVGLYIVLGLAGTTVTKLSRCLLPYQATMFVVSLIITFVPWLIYIVPSLLGLYAIPGR
jgi:C4-dicarboxylate transporter DctM subunit